MIGGREEGGSPGGGLAVCGAGAGQRPTRPRVRHAAGSGNRPARLPAPGAGGPVSLLASHQGDLGSIPDWVTPDLRMWESCPTMPLVGEFSRGSPVSPAISFRRCYILTSFCLIGSQDLDVKIRPNLFTSTHIITFGRKPQACKYLASFFLEQTASRPLFAVFPLPLKTPVVKHEYEWAGFQPVARNSFFLTSFPPLHAVPHRNIILPRKRSNVSKMASLHNSMPGRLPPITRTASWLCTVLPKGILHIYVVVEKGTERRRVIDGKTARQFSALRVEAMRESRWACLGRPYRSHAFRPEATDNCGKPCPQCLHDRAIIKYAVLTNHGRTNNETAEA
ncbi:hypothetical protein PR048_026229 [Dryococelus australis]|uniref:Uncharacterized protein n=1 Tax=Dryococelus australis TaxID=614101 RepID=A0ABQ9GKR8_9NEOP|nr:hypothetical protein PR048_026229 [Dryococelus australis]